MRVNVSCSVNIEEVPKVVKALASLYNDLKEQKNTHLQSLMTELDCDNITESLNQIDEIRKILLRMDEIMIDFESILSGYQRTMINIRAPQVEEDKDES